MIRPGAIIMMNYVSSLLDTMDYNTLANLQFCKTIVDGYSSLLYYTHIPSALIALGLGLFVYFKNKQSNSARLLLALSIVFALWTLADLAIWFTYDKSAVLMFLWSIIGILSTGLFSLTFFFIFAFVTGRQIPMWLIAIWVVLFLPVLVFMPTHFNLESFDTVNCVAVENNLYLIYYHGIGLLTVLAIPFIPLLRRKTDDARTPLPAVTIAVLGSELFLITFLVTSFLASYLVDAGIVPDFGLEQYGIGTMTLFMGLLAYVIVQYRAFNLQVLAVRALVIGLIGLVASQFTFISNPIGYALASITLIMTAYFGFILIRNVKREIAQREKIEKLAGELEQANQQQVVLIHFITHQIKGFVAKSRNIFAMIKEGEYGPVPEAMVPMIEEGFRSDTKGAQTIQEILNAANIKSGKVAYTMKAFDLKELIEGIVRDLLPLAQAKGLELSSTLAPVSLTGDKTQLVNAFKNLIDNSIKYTPKGSVNVLLNKADGKVRFEIKDTGVGISSEDMKNLFTEGGHGKNSQKINVESTGFGLYIVKNIIEAHKGRVWAESEGEGKGSHFIVELPV